MVDSLSRDISNYRIYVLFCKGEITFSPRFSKPKLLYENQEIAAKPTKSTGKTKESL